MLSDLLINYSEDKIVLLIINLLLFVTLIVFLLRNVYNFFSLFYILLEITMTNEFSSDLFLQLKL